MTLRALLNTNEFIRLDAECLHSPDKMMRERGVDPDVAVPQDLRDGDVLGVQEDRQVADLGLANAQTLESVASNLLQLEKARPVVISSPSFLTLDRGIILGASRFRRRK